MTSSVASLGKQVCIVTGGGGPRIGSSVCRVLAENGWHVVVTDVDLAAAQEVTALLRADGCSAEALEMDTAVPESVQGAVQRVGTVHGRIDGLVNSAGIGLVLPVDQLDGERYARLLDVDLRGPLLCAQQVLPFMRSAGGGSIVNIGSVHALANLPGNSLYSAAKAGLVGLTRGLACDLGRYGVRCNIVHPGEVPSPADVAAARSTGQRYLYGPPFTRQLLPWRICGSDIGHAVAFLMSHHARAITGTELVVDAGATVALVDRDLLEHDTVNSRQGFRPAERERGLPTGTTRQREAVVAAPGDGRRA